MVLRGSSEMFGSSRSLWETALSVCLNASNPLFVNCAGSEPFVRIKAIALDVDGVLTDGGFWWGPNGEEWKRFSFADIMGVSLAKKAGLLITLISGEDSPLVDRFAVKMGIADVYKNCKDKAGALRNFAERR